MGGINPLQPDQIQGWMELNGIRLTSVEVDLIFDMDASFRISMTKEYERNRPKPEDMPRPSRGARRR